MTTPNTVSPAQRLHAKLLATPVEGRAEIVRALTEANGVATRAAALLGISQRTMVRLLTDPWLAAEVERIRGARRAQRGKRS